MACSRNRHGDIFYLTGRHCLFLISTCDMYLLVNGPHVMSPNLGIFDEGPQCCMFNLRNVYVSCRYFCNSHVNLKIVLYRMSNLDWHMSCH